jgi:GNAT superfamily N-acetyltransferase
MAGGNPQTMVDLDIRPATPDDLDACARLAAGEDDRPAHVHRDRLAAYLTQPDRIHSLVATVARGDEPAGPPRRDEGGAPAGEPAGAPGPRDEGGATADEPAGPPPSRVVGAARVSLFEPGANAPLNVAPPGWYLVGLVVAPEWRRHGIGLALSAARVRWALERAPEVWYFTGTRNRASFALHARLGFEEVTRDFWFPRVPFEHGGILCSVTAETFRLPDR